MLFHRRVKPTVLYLLIPSTYQTNNKNTDFSPLKDFFIELQATPKIANNDSIWTANLTVHHNGNVPVDTRIAQQAIVFIAVNN